VFDVVERLMSATNTATIATGILNLWMHSPEETAAAPARLTAAHGDRFLVGIGVSHAPLIDAQEPGRYRKPLGAMASFLDGLDAAPRPLPRSTRVLAALGPKMLELARARAAGVHPYNVTPEHTALARAALGPSGLVLPEQAVALTTDPGLGRKLGRDHTPCAIRVADATKGQRMTASTGASTRAGVTTEKALRTSSGLRSESAPAAVGPSLLAATSPTSGGPDRPHSAPRQTR
jgi:probable F420-dependent oxidoreductase